MPDKKREYRRPTDRRVNRPPDQDQPVYTSVQLGSVVADVLIPPDPDSPFSGEPATPPCAEAPDSAAGTDSGGSGCGSD